MANVISFRDAYENLKFIPGFDNAAEAAAASISQSASEYEIVLANQFLQVLGRTGAIGDYLAGLLVIPTNTSPGPVSVYDNNTTINLFAGGNSSVSNLIPFFVPIRAISVNGAWRVSTGSNVSVVAVGNFTEGPPPVPAVPQSLRLSQPQNPNSITVTWNALGGGADYQVEVYTPDDVWVSLGGTMGGITKGYGVDDGMIFGATYSFRVRSTFDFVNFSEWSTSLTGVVAPLQALFYIDQGSALWNDTVNWFTDQAGTIPHNAVPTVSYNCVIVSGNTVDQVPSSGYNSVINYGTVTTNNGTITTNNNTVITNDGTITTNNGTITTNNGTITTNYATVTTNNGTVGTNMNTVYDNYGTVDDNYGTVTTNNGTITLNYATVTLNYATVTTNESGGTVAINYATVTTNNGTVDSNESGGTVTLNYATVTTNNGTITTNNNTVDTNASGGTITTNNGTVTYNCGTIGTDNGTSGPCPT